MWKLFYQRLACLLLLLSLVLPLYSDVNLTDKEFQAIKSALEESIQDLNKAKSDLTEARNELTLVQTQLTQVSTDSKALYQSLTQQKSETMIYQVSSVVLGIVACVFGIGYLMK